MSGSRLSLRLAPPVEFPMTATQVCEQPGFFHRSTEPPSKWNDVMFGDRKMKESVEPVKCFLFKATHQRSSGYYFFKRAANRHRRKFPRSWYFSLRLTFFLGTPGMIMCNVTDPYDSPNLIRSIRGKQQLPEVTKHMGSTQRQVDKSYDGCLNIVTQPGY